MQYAIAYDGVRVEHSDRAREGSCCCDVLLDQHDERPLVIDEPLAGRPGYVAEGDSERAGRYYAPIRARGGPLTPKVRLPTTSS
jgi:hypothetical protein